MAGRTIRELTKRHRDVLLDRVINPRDTDTAIGLRHGYTRTRVNTIIRSELGRAYARELEDRIISESIKACAVAPALAAFQDAMSIPVGRQRRK
jgi:hypothetical protein